jgi:ABC-type nitrate/sulfonate/bicarbonate transport system substrate-binding protein
MARFPLLLAVAAIALAGCGGGTVQTDSDVKLALARPGAVHAGIYLAVQRGFDEALGVTLHPTVTADPVRALRTAQAGLAVLDIHDLAIARARGADIVGVMAIVGQPVPELRPPRLRAAMQRVAAKPPPYPELVLAALRSTLTDNGPLVQEAVAALQRGYREAYIDPESAAQALTTALPRLNGATVAADLDRLGPAFQGSLPTFGELDPARLRAWARWEPRTGLVRSPPDVARAFDGQYVQPG